MASDPTLPDPALPWDDPTLPAKPSWHRPRLEFYNMVDNTGTGINAGSDGDDTPSAIS